MVSNLGDLTSTKLPPVLPQAEPEAAPLRQTEPLGQEDESFERMVSRGIAPRQDHDQVGEVADELPMEDEEEESESFEADPLPLQIPVAAVGKKQQAMLKFMVSMEGELGITPDAFMKALGSLDSRDMAQPPEQSMAKVLSQLDLSPEEAEHAAGLYAAMLVASGFLPQAAQAAAAQPAVPMSDMKFQVMTKEQLRKSEINSNVGKLQTSFFNTDEFSSRR